MKVNQRPSGIGGVDPGRGFMIKMCEKGVNSLAVVVATWQLQVSKAEQENKFVYGINAP